MVLVVLGCSSSNDSLAPPGKSRPPGTSFAETRSRIALLTDEQVPSVWRWSSFARISNNGGWETIEALILSIDDPREVPSPPESSGSEVPNRTLRWTVGRVCRHMLLLNLHARLDGAFARSVVDWHSWWEANHLLPLDEVRKKVAAIDGKKWHASVDSSEVRGDSTFLAGFGPTKLGLFQKPLTCPPFGLLSLFVKRPYLDRPVVVRDCQ